MMQRAFKKYGPELLEPPLMKRIAVLFLGGRALSVSLDASFGSVDTVRPMHDYDK